MDGQAVHRIDFAGIKGFRRSGTVYLDTASLAFAGLDVTVYDLTRLGFLKTDVLVYQVRFEKRGNKWYLRTKDVNQKFEFNGRGQYIVAYHALSVNDEPARSFGYSETIQRVDENKTFQKPASAEAWQPFQKRIQQLDADDYLPVLATPYVASTPAADSMGRPTGIQPPFLARLLTYLDEGVHTLVGLQSAAVAPRYPGTGSVVPTDAVRMQLLIGYRFRLYRGLYAHAQFGGNFGIGGTRSSVGVTGLSYDFVLNQRHRPMVLAPLAGLHSQQLRSKGAGLRETHRTWVAGLQWRIERSRRTSWFVQGLYHWPMNNSSHGQPFSGFSSQPVRFSIGAGLFLR